MQVVTRNHEQVDENTEQFTTVLFGTQAEVAAIDTDPTVCLRILALAECGDPGDKWDWPSIMTDEEHGRTVIVRQLRYNCI
jgi:hypothetical protein